METWNVVKSKTHQLFCYISALKTANELSWLLTKIKGGGAVGWKEIFILKYWDSCAFNAWIFLQC